MVWGTFTSVHIGTLVCAFLLMVLLYNVLVNKSRKTQILTLLVLSEAVLGVVVYNMFKPEFNIENAPFSLWSLSAVLLPYAVISRRKWICNLLILWPIESLTLLIFNYDMADVNVISSEFFIYFLTHTLIFAIPLLLFWLKLVERDYKYMKRSLIFTALVYTGVHFFNVAMGTNFLYSQSHAGNELFALFRTLVPLDYWYMYLIIPFFVFYLSWWYLPEILDHRRKTKRLRQRLKVVDKYYDEYEDEYIDEIIEEKYGR